MDEVDFTAGITLQDDRVFTVDVVGIDAAGLAYTSPEGRQVVPWSDVKAVMRATSDHMLESSGYLFSMSELVQQGEDAQPYEAARLRQTALGLLQQVAPRICPLGQACGLRPGTG